MAYLTLDTEKLKRNFHYLDRHFRRNDIEWAVVSKLLCGNEVYLNALAELNPTQICDSRLTNLKAVKRIMPGVETIYIKPPTLKTASKVVSYADISCNTSLATIKALSDAATAMDTCHRIIIMIETGELREGVLPEKLAAFYNQIRFLPCIEVIGLGTNHACMYGILPSFENLKTLEACRSMLEEQFGCQLELLSGGASVAIPLIGTKELPAGINHFRVGETLFFGTNVYDNTPIEEMQQDIIMLHANIIELRDKPDKPYGNYGYTLTKEKKPQGRAGKALTSSRAILDIGLLDIDVKHLQPVDPFLRIAGASSDMMVVDIENNAAGYRVGGTVAFRLDYMGALRAINSKYIEKRLLSRNIPFKWEQQLVLVG